MSKSTSYRDSHSAVGYGQRYVRTYSEGYYYEQWQRIERPILESIFAEARDDGVQKTLDFACGTGRILSVAEQFFANTTGVDVSEDMLQHAKSVCHKSTVKRQDITREPLGEQFDLATAFRFFLNAEEELRKSALDAISAALKPSGLLVANVHVNSSSPLGLYYRARNSLTNKDKARTYSHLRFEELLAQCGFEIEKTIWYGYLPRTGWYLGGLAARLMEPVERLGNSRIIPKRFAQSFVVVCRKQS